MSMIVSSVASLLLGMALLMLANGLLGTLISLRTAIDGFPAPVTGLVMSSYFAGLVLGSLFCRGIIRRVGHIRAFSALASLLSATALAHVFLVSAPAWALFRGLTGFCLAGLYMVTESWLNARANNQTRGQILALYMATAYLAMGAGQFLLPLADPSSFTLFGVVSVLFSLALVPVALTRSSAPQLERPSRLSFRRLYEISPLGVVGCLASGLVTGAIYGMAPIFGRGIGLSISGVSVLMGTLILGGLVAQWPIGRLSDHFDRRSVITFVACAAALVAGAVALLAEVHDARLVLALAGLFGALGFPIYSLSVAHANDFLEADDLVEASGGMIIAYGIGAALGPMAAAGFMGRIGPAGLFVFEAIIAGLLFVFAVYRTYRRKAPPVAEQAPFVMLPRTSPVVAKLDPRGEAETADQGPAAGVEAPASASSTPGRA